MENVYELNDGSPNMSLLIFINLINARCMQSSCGSFQQPLNTRLSCFQNTPSVKCIYVETVSQPFCSCRWLGQQGPHLFHSSFILNRILDMLANQQHDTNAGQIFCSLVEGQISVLVVKQLKFIKVMQTDKKGEVECEEVKCVAERYKW